MYSFLEEIIEEDTEIFIENKRVNSVSAVFEFIEDFADEKCKEWFAENANKILETYEVEKEIIEKFSKYENIHLMNDEQIHEVIEKESIDYIVSYSCLNKDDLCLLSSDFDNLIELAKEEVEDARLELED